MRGPFKVRLQDGSEVGPLDLEMMQSWYRQGMVDRDSRVRPAGARQWVRLMDAVDIRDWEDSDGWRAGRAAADDIDEGPEEETGPQPWRSYVGSLLFFLAAIGGGYFALAPERWLPSLAPMPWREVVLVNVLLGLLLVRGWEPTRKLARVIVFLLTFSVFPLAGFVLVQGVRGAALAVLCSAWVMGSGLFFFLSGRRLPWQSAVLSLLWALVGAVGVGYFGVVPHVARAATAPPPATTAVDADR